MEYTRPDMRQSLEKTLCPVFAETVDAKPNWATKRNQATKSIRTCKSLYTAQFNSVDDSLIWKDIEACESYVYQKLALNYNSEIEQKPFYFMKLTEL